MKIKIVVVRVGQQPKIEEIENTLQAMKDIVGGWIEGVGLGNRIQLICNEEGLMLKLPQNGCGILGDFFITKYDGMGENVSLDDSECEMLLAWVVTHRAIKHSGRSDLKITIFESLEDMQRNQENEEFNDTHRN